MELQEKKINNEERRVIEIGEHEERAQSNLLKEIETKRKIYKEDVDKYFDRLVADIKDRIDSIGKCVDKEREKISQTRKHFAEKKRQSETLISTRDASEFFNSSPILLSNVKCKIPVSSFSSPQSMLKFVPLYEHLPEKMMGMLKETTEQGKIKKNLQLRVKREYTSDMECCHYIACSEQYFFIAENQSRTLAKILLQTHFIKTIFKKMMTRITHIETLHPLSEDMLLADRTPILKLVNGSTGKIRESKYTAGSLLIIAVHVTLDSKVIVGARSPGNAFPIQGRRVVIVMDFDGNHLAEWEYNKHGERLFSIPRPSASVSNGNIFVRDHISSSDSGHVIILKPTGGVLNNYTGHPDINNDLNPFTPAGMTRTPSDNVIVCDCSNNALHLLNNKGVSLSYIDTTVFGIFRPFCITLNTKDKKIMYIGCATTVTSTEKAKLYEMELTELE